MKNGLASRLSKLALIPLISLCLTTGLCAEERKKIDQSIILEANLRPHLGGQNSRQKLVPYENWQSYFHPRPPSNSDLYTVGSLTAGIDVGLAAKFRFGKFDIGPSVTFPLAETDFVKGLEAAWWDPVTVESLSVSKSPSLGLSADYSFGHYEELFIEASFSVHNYNIVKTDYRGVDVIGGVNYSKTLRKDTIEKGLGWKASALLYLGARFHPNIGFGLSVEKDGDLTKTEGIVNFRLPLNIPLNYAPPK